MDLVSYTVSAGITDVGKRRLSNEDAYLVDDELGLYVVADGMGGHAAGEVASQEAVDNVHSMVKQNYAEIQRVVDGKHSPEAIRQAIRVLEGAAQAATYMVYAIAQNEPDQQGMGTTLSALLLCGPYGITAQVGDSRVYLVRGGRCIQLTEDHTLVAWQMRKGLITEEEAEKSPHKNVITRAVGSRDYVQVDTHFFPTKVNDTYLLCSDGLHGYVEGNEVSELAVLPPHVATKRFVDVANARGGKDNITAVVVRIKEPPPAEST